MTSVDLDHLKKAAALKAIEFVRDGMVVGLGTGSTAKHLLVALGERVRAGMKLRGVSTSQETAALAKQAGIPLIDAENRWEIDVAIDGADQVDPHFNLIKGGGGALLKEKIVAASAKQFIVMVDHTKQVPVLGGSFPLPIEIIPFGWGSTAREIEALTKSRVVLRERNGAPFRTEAGNLIVDVHIDRISQPGELETA
ncbi:MAG: ribose-5-phosphate isomerase RpiA, partial [Nitrospira sp.]